MNRFINRNQPLRLNWDNDYIFYCTNKQEKIFWGHQNVLSPGHEK